MVVVVVMMFSHRCDQRPQGLPLPFSASCCGWSRLLQRAGKPSSHGQRCRVREVPGVPL